MIHHISHGISHGIIHSYDTIKTHDDRISVSVSVSVFVVCFLQCYFGSSPAYAHAHVRRFLPFPSLCMIDLDITGSNDIMMTFVFNLTRHRTSYYCRDKTKSHTANNNNNNNNTHEHKYIQYNTHT